MSENLKEIRKKKELERKNIEFKQKLEAKFKDLFIPLEDYKGREISISFKCNQCGNIFTSSPKSILNNKGLGCKNCYSKNVKSSKALSTEEVINRIKEKYDDEFQLVGEYNGFDKKSKIFHKKCGNTTDMSIGDLLRKGKIREYCSKCANYTKEKPFKEEVNEIDSNFEVLGEYKNNKTKIEILHKTCGNSFFMTPNRFLSGDRCPHCGGTKRKDYDEFKQQVETVQNGRFTLLSESYVNNVTKYEFYDKETKEYFSMQGKQFIMKYCDSKLGKDGNGLTEEEFLDKVYNFNSTNKEFKLISKFINTQHEITFQHKCGEIIKFSTSNPRKVLSCHKCHKNMSAGELTIFEYLKANNIDFIKEKTFSDCLIERNLRFDFFIPKDKLLIEYDGIQHFKGWKKDKKDLDLIKQRDEAKNEWVRNHPEYSLIRIRYDQDLEKILDDIFVKEIIDEDVFSINIEEI